MRCPKCGFISFDNVSKCLKCSKDISEATKAFQGSTLNVVTPSFLNIPLPSEDDMQIEGAAEVDGEIEFADPDLEILVDDGDLEGTLDFDLEGDDDDESRDTKPFEEAAEDDIELSADLGQFEDVSDDDTFSFEDFDDEDEQEDTPGSDFAAMDMPEELADISDLSPPEISTDDESPAEENSDPDQFQQLEEEEPQQATAAAEPENDLDFSNLDFDLGSAEEEAAAGDDVLAEQAPAAEAEELSPAAIASMDEDLDFDLDLGGLSIHDERT